MFLTSSSSTSTKAKPSLLWIFPLVLGLLKADLTCLYSKEAKKALRSLAFSLSPGALPIPLLKSFSFLNPVPACWDSVLVVLPGHLLLLPPLLHFQNSAFQENNSSADVICIHSFIHSNNLLLVWNRPQDLCIHGLDLFFIYLTYCQMR